MGPASNPRSQDNLGAAAAAADVAAERRLLSSVLLLGRLPSAPVTVGDFIDPEHAAIWPAISAVAARGEDINAIAVWHQDQQLDVVRLCEIQASVALSDREHSWLIDAYSEAVRARSRRRERVAA